MSYSDEYYTAEEDSNRRPRRSFLKQKRLKDISDSGIPYLHKVSMDKKVNGPLDKDKYIIGAKLHPGNTGVHILVATKISGEECKEACKKNPNCTGVEYSRTESGVCSLYGDRYTYYREPRPEEDQITVPYILPNIPSKLESVCRVEPIPAWCDENMKTICQKDVAKSFDSEDCRLWAHDHPSSWVDQALINYRMKKTLAEALADPDLGCFMGVDFYDKYYKDLQEKVKFKVQIPIPACTYTKCAA